MFHSQSRFVLPPRSGPPSNYRVKVSSVTLSSDDNYLACERSHGITVYAYRDILPLYADIFNHFGQLQVALMPTASHECERRGIQAVDRTRSHFTTRQIPVISLSVPWNFKSCACTSAFATMAHGDRRRQRGSFPSLLMFIQVSRSLAIRSSLIGHIARPWCTNHGSTLTLMSSMLYLRHFHVVQCMGLQPCGDMDRNSNTSGERGLVDFRPWRPASPG